MSRLAARLGCLSESAGKSLTVQQLVRECHRPLHAASSASSAEAAAGTAAGASKALSSPARVLGSQPAQLLPPVLISINCMTLSDPQRVAGAVVGCYHAAAAACAQPGPGKRPRLSAQPPAWYLSDGFGMGNFQTFDGCDLVALVWVVICAGMLCLPPLEASLCTDDKATSMDGS